MVSLFAFYRWPNNEAEFLIHYRDVHVPLALQLPGLLSLNWGRPTPLGGVSDDSWFLLAEMRFTDREALDQALQSSPGKAASEDLKTFAKGLFTMRAVEWQ